MTEREVQKLRRDFPLIEQSGLTYFDNAATMQRPHQVIKAVTDFYEKENANPLRGLYDLSVQATSTLEAAREKVAKFVGAEQPEEIIFTSGVTAAINLLTLMLESVLSSDDEVVIGDEGHHSNILPWLELSRRARLKLNLVTPNQDGSMSVKNMQELLTPNTRVVATTLMSNVTGVLTDVREVSEAAFGDGRAALTVVDAAQAVAHMPINVGKLGAGFLVFSGHKIGAPMGVGVLYGVKDVLENLRPGFFGGEMVDNVMRVRGAGALGVNLAKVPQRFEAGTLNMGGIVGLVAAIDYWEQHDKAHLFKYIDDLTDYAAEQLMIIPEIRLLACEHGIISFNLDGVHPHDVAQVLNAAGICVRAGYHCAQPLLEYLEAGPVVRVSLSFYNTKAEIDRLAAELKTVRRKMGL